MLLPGSCPQIQSPRGHAAISVPPRRFRCAPEAFSVLVCRDSSPPPPIVLPPLCLSHILNKPNGRLHFLLRLLLPLSLPLPVLPTFPLPLPYTLST